MFKSKNVADEVYKSMRSIMVKQARSTKDQKIEKLSEIIDCINKAAELSDQVGLKTEAEVLTCLLSKIAGVDGVDAYDPEHVQKLLNDELFAKDKGESKKSVKSRHKKLRNHDANIKMRPLFDKNQALDVDDFTKGYDFGTRGSEVFLDGDGHVLCKDCAKENQDNVVSGEIHFEGHPISCEYCNADIPSVNGVDSSEMAPLDDENYTKSESKEKLPTDYEPCGECGYDHSYEPQEAYDWHKKSDENHVVDKVDQLISGSEKKWLDADGNLISQQEFSDKYFDGAPIPNDYEQCSECGYDHEYETEAAWKAHEAMGKFDEKEPSEYEECLECGLDHNEDPAGAINWHSSHNKLKKKL